MRWGRPAAAAAGMGAAAVAAAYAMARTARGWRAAAGNPAATGDPAGAGLALPGDLRHHHVAVDDGGSIHAVERGAGPPLVLVHGVTLGVAAWAPQLRSLADRHRVIAVGQRGHGRSTAGSGGYSLERLADDLLAVLGALEVEGAVLVGHSMGGMVAQLLVVRHPAAVRRHVGALVLVATSAGPMVPGPARAPVGAWLAGAVGHRLQEAERRGGGVLPGRSLGDWLTRVSFGARPGPAELALTRAMIDAMSPAALSALLGPLLAFDVHDRLGTVDLPTTVMVGSRDVLVPPRVARALAAAVSGAELVVLPGCGHMVMLERPGELDELLCRASAALAAGCR